MYCDRVYFFVLITLNNLCVSFDRKYIYLVDQDEFWNLWAEKRRGRWHQIDTKIAR